MKKSNLLLSLSKKYPFLDTSQINQIFNIIFDEMTKALKNNKRIEIRGFGSFSLRSRKVQTSFPSEDNRINLIDRNVIYFRMGKELFNQLNHSDENK